MIQSKSGKILVILGLALVLTGIIVVSVIDYHNKNPSQSEHEKYIQTAIMYNNIQNGNYFFCEKNPDNPSCIERGLR